MKKRILALALAGTTAFSVFGAALSAYADSVPATEILRPSAHWASEVDAYKSYTPVAKTIDVQKGSKGTTTSKEDTWVDLEKGTRFELDAAETAFNGDGKYKTKEDYVATVYSTIDEYEENGSEYTFIYTTHLYQPANDPTAESKWFTTLNNRGGGDHVKEGADGDSTITLQDDTVWNLVENKTQDVKTTATVAKDGTVTIGTDTYAPHLSIDGKTQVYDFDGKKDQTFDQLIDSLSVKYGTATSQKVYAVKAAYAATETAIDNSKVATLPTIKSIVDKLVDVSEDSVGTSTLYGINVTDREGQNNTAWYNWHWNNNTDGTANIDVWEDNSYYIDTDKDGKLDTLYVDQKNVPTIYAYDFLWTNATTANAPHWNYGKEYLTTVVDELLYADATTATLVAETGRGIYGRGIRADVISDWEDFLDELAVHHNEKQYAINTYDEFESNYSDMYQSGYYYDPLTGQATNKTWTTDIYNIKGLLKDIWAMSYPSTYEKANTSQMLYLMQEYNKYIGNYITPDAVENDDWGDLLLSILKSANEEDFKRGAADYKKYMRQVEALEDAYNDATTASMVKAAEEHMYNMLTKMDYTKASSKNWYELYGAMSGLYFNAKDVPSTYTVAPSAPTNAEFTNYNYLVAVSKKSDTTYGKDYYTWTNTFTAGYYTLYPMADYIDWDATTPNELYPGNTNAGTDYKGAYATEEYEWFWNVYQLANNMLYGANEYKGVLDAVKEALEEAVAALNPVETPTATEVSALDEMVEHYADKLGIESDYNENYYGKYTQALAFADEAEGKYQTRVARYIVGVAGEALTYQGTQVTVTKNDIKNLQNSIKEGQTALKAIKEDKNYNAAQVNELNKAIATAQDIVDMWNGTYSNSASKQSVNKIGSKLVGDKDQFVKSDLTNAIDAINSAIDYSEIVMDWSKNDAGKWMYGTEDGYLSNGWNQIGSVWYYFNEDGTAKQSEWMQLDGKWYWFNSNAGAAIGWAKVDGQWYYFGGNNAMKTGWQKVDGSWYYLASSGRMITGWAQVDGKWYYMSKESNSLGQMLANTTTPDGYKVGADGAMLTK